MSSAILPGVHPGPDAPHLHSEPGWPWLREALWLVGAAAFVTVIFALTPLDIEAARVFYRPDSAVHWPFAQQPPWSFLYGAAPWMTATLVLAGLLALVAGHLRQQSTLRRQAVFLLLSVAIGPGLLINSVFKDHWDRPRPREIIAFDGPLEYVSAPLRGREAGASFPCGHCSVGFLYGAGWWIWRRRRVSWARVSLAVGISAGLALGLGRMAAGGHFLSDVIWSALLAYGVCHILYFHVLRLHRCAAVEAVTQVEQRSRVSWSGVTALVAVLAGAGVLMALFATPHGTPLNTVIPWSSLSRAPKVFTFEARAADVEITLLDPPPAQLSVVGELHGFGLPSSRLRTFVAFNPGPEATLRYRIDQNGWFTDLDGVAVITVPAAGLERLVVRLERGNIKIRDATAAGVVRNDVLHLDLKTASGHVQVTEANSR